MPLSGLAWPGKAADLLRLAAVDTEPGVVLAYGVLIRPLEQAVHLPARVVVQRDLANAETVGPAVPGVLGDPCDGLGGTARSS